MPQNVEQRSMLSSLASAGKQRAMASATKIKPRKKCIMSGYRVTKCDGVLEVHLSAQAKSPKSQVLRAVSRWLPSTSSDGGTTTSLAFPYGPFLRCPECSSFCLYLFNMDFHYTTLNVHRSSLFLRNTSKSCIEIHLLIKDIYLHLADTILSSSILGYNFLFTHFSDTIMIVTAYKNK